MILGVVAQNPGIRFGELQKSRREQTMDPTTGVSYTQRRIAELVTAMTGEMVSRSKVASIEAGKVATPEASYTNAVCKILDISGLEAVQAIGFEVDAPALTEMEREFLAGLRRLRGDPRMQDAALAVVRALPLGPLRELDTPRRRRSGN